MKKSDEFIVQFEGLKLGSHHFDWEINESFFDDFGEVEFGKGQFQVDMELTKQNNMLILEFDVKGKVPFPCDLCLEDIHVSVSHKEQVIVKFSSDAPESTDDMVVLGIHAHEIDVKQFIYEFIAISVPFKRTCDKPGQTASCNKEVLKHLSAFELSETATTEEEPGENGDGSPWDGLKSLKDKFNNN